MNSVSASLVINATEFRLTFRCVQGFSICVSFGRSFASLEIIRLLVNDSWLQVVDHEAYRASKYIQMLRPPHVCVACYTFPSDKIFFGILWWTPMTCHRRFIDQTSITSCKDSVIDRIQLGSMQYTIRSLLRPFATAEQCWERMARRTSMAVGLAEGPRDCGNCC